LVKKTKKTDLAKFSKGGVGGREGFDSFPAFSTFFVGHQNDSIFLTKLPGIKTMGMGWSV
jgi:hypothetical protein